MVFIEVVFSLLFCSPVHEWSPWAWERWCWLFLESALCRHSLFMMQMMLLSLLPLPLLCAWCLTLVFILLAHTLWCLIAAKTQLIRFACCSSPIADSANFKFTACSEVEPVSHLGDILNCDLSDYDDITCISRRRLRTCVGKQTAFFWLWSFHKDHANYFNISFPVWFCSVAVILHWTTLPWSAYI